MSSSSSRFASMIASRTRAKIPFVRPFSSNNLLASPDSVDGTAIVNATRPSMLEGRNSGFPSSVAACTALSTVKEFRDDIKEVNATRSSMLEGGKIHNAIHSAAGPELREACLAVPPIRGVRCPVGEARLTLAARGLHYLRGNLAHLLPSSSFIRKKRLPPLPHYHIFSVYVPKESTTGRVIDFSIDLNQVGPTVLHVLHYIGRDYPTLLTNEFPKNSCMGRTCKKCAICIDGCNRLACGTIIDRSVAITRITPLLPDVGFVRLVAKDFSDFVTIYSQLPQEMTSKDIVANFITSSPSYWWVKKPSVGARVLLEAQARLQHPLIELHPQIDMFSEDMQDMKERLEKVESALEKTLLHQMNKRFDILEAALEKQNQVAAMEKKKSRWQLFVTAGAGIEMLRSHGPTAVEGILMILTVLYEKIVILLGF